MVKGLKTIYGGMLLGERIAHELRYSIISGKVKKETVLSENSLAKEFGTSRAPVRDALRVLSKEGLIALEKTGVRIIGVTLEDMRELYDVRFLIERFALERLNHFNEEIERELNIIIDKMELAIAHDDSNSFADYDIEFHEVILRSIQHKKILTVWEGIKYINHAALRIATEKRFEEDKESLQDSIIHHRNMIKALKSNDEEYLKKVVHDHYHDTITTVSKSAYLNEY